MINKNKYMLPSKKKKNDKKFEFYAKFKSKGDKKKGGSGVQRLECWRMVRTRAGSNFFQNLVGAFSSILVDFFANLRKSQQKNSGNQKHFCASVSSANPTVAVLPPEEKAYIYLNVRSIFWTTQNFWPQKLHNLNKNFSTRKHQFALMQLNET